MSSVQTKISFPSKKKSFRLHKKKAKENGILKATSPSTIALERSPLKSNSVNVNSPKRSSSVGCEASPPKIQHTSPSDLIRDITIGPKKNAKGTNSYSPARKELFSDQHDPLNAAKKALHSALPVTLPAREDKLEHLFQIFKSHLDDCKSDSLYICGPPGTGKTACLKSIIAIPEIQKGYKIVFINCTGLKSSGAIYSHISQELNLKIKSRTEKSCKEAIQNYLASSKKMNLFILDEMDQLESRGQTILYSIFEWATISNKEKTSLVVVGIANSLDLTERALPRLTGRSHLKPKVIHFAPYSRDQIITIIKHRLIEANCTEVFELGALQLLASKIATISGDIRRTLDISSRLIDIALSKSEGNKISVASVLDTINTVYGTSGNLSVNKETSSADCFPLQQKLLICSLMLIKLKSKIKDVSIGRLHDVYKKVCEKRNFPILDMSEFISLVELVEVQGIIQRQGKQLSRMTKVVLQWDVKEVSSALKDKNLLASILEDKSCISL